MRLLENKVALITGAYRGIGSAIAVRLAKEGAKVAVNDISTESANILELIKAVGGTGLPVQAAVNDPCAVKEMFDFVSKELGSVDILVNNAGITKDGLIMRMSDEQFDMVIDVNLKGAFYCTREAIKMMIKKKYGKIINMSSVVGFAGNIGQANYIASKSAIHGLTKATAAEMGTRGIRVNTVAPGFIKTEMTDVLADDLKKAMIDQTLLKTLGTVDDIANVVNFLASPESDYITGQVLHVNGGMY